MYAYMYAVYNDVIANVGHVTCVQAERVRLAQCPLLSRPRRGRPRPTRHPGPRPAPRSWSLRGGYTHTWGKACNLIGG